MIEVGPGYGATTDILCEKAPRLTSVEIDEVLASMLTERFDEKSNVEIVVGDATALGYPDGRFTGAACFTMLHHVPTVALQDRLFAEVSRVLRPGAALVASDSLASDELAAHHEDDTYNPVDPDTLAAASRQQASARWRCAPIRSDGPRSPGSESGQSGRARDVSAVLGREHFGFADLPPVPALAAVLVHHAFAQVDVFEEAGPPALGAAGRLSPNELRRLRLHHHLELRLRCWVRNLA